MQRWMYKRRTRRKQQCVYEDMQCLIELTICQTHWSLTNWNTDTEWQPIALQLTVYTLYRSRGRTGGQGLHFKSPSTEFVLVGEKQRRLAAEDQSQGGKTGLKVKSQLVTVSHPKNHIKKTNKKKHLHVLFHIRDVDVNTTSTHGWWFLNSWSQLKHKQVIKTSPSHLCPHQRSHSTRQTCCHYLFHFCAPLAFSSVLPSPLLFAVAGNVSIFFSFLWNIWRQLGAEDCIRHRSEEFFGTGWAFSRSLSLIPICQVQFSSSTRGFLARVTRIDVLVYGNECGQRRGHTEWAHDPS